MGIRGGGGVEGSGEGNGFEGDRRRTEGAMEAFLMGFPEVDKLVRARLTFAALFHDGVKGACGGRGVGVVKGW